MLGFFLINKPAGMTSHDVVDYLRRVTGEKRIGHAGTLDPIAEGLMIVAVGREYTKQLDNFLKLDKTYLATATLGSQSTTFDSEGELTPVSKEVPSAEAVQGAISAMVGKQSQMPPDFSAKKINGKKAYELAREGKAVVLEPKAVEIYDAKLIRYKYPIVEFEVRVSSGTYIRTLINDLGLVFKTGAYMSGLVRTAIDEFLLQNAIELDKIKTPKDLESRILPLQ